MSSNRMWTLTEMRIALARHDIGTVFKIMQRYGYPQREIAALTGTAQSDVSEVISGRRKIQAYAVLERLVDGLQLPRGWAGLAFDDDTATLRVNCAVPGGVGGEVDLTRPAVLYGKEARGAGRRARRLLTN